MPDYVTIRGTDAAAKYAALKAAMSRVSTTCDASFTTPYGVAQAAASCCDIVTLASELHDALQALRKPEVV